MFLKVRHCVFCTNDFNNFYDLNVLFLGVHDFTSFHGEYTTLTEQ